MSDLNAALAGFSRVGHCNSFPPGTPTAYVMRAVRLFLVQAVPGWRGIAFASTSPGYSSFEVEFHLREVT